ncbi:MAG TPA: gephyrin-like molybdotransferase Glp [Actinomycetes bacterium]|nr:gephyrin-like molybdotransferase Glp [Actinomycetes bacterium]
MRTVDEHLEVVLAHISPLDPMDLRLLDAQGCSLSDDVSAPWDLPPFDNSSMDGYAVRAADVAGASEATPVSLPVVGDIPAGHSGALALAPGQTARIMTGAPMPAGADAVVPVEWTDGDIVRVSIHRAPEPDAFVRHRGEDAVANSMVLSSGTRLGAAQIGLLAAVGRGRVVVRPRPRVVVMSTGSELVEPGEPIAGGKIPDSNSFMIAAAAHATGATAYRIGFVPDEPQTLIATIEDQLIRADLVITTGGVSVGAFDVVKEALSRMGSVNFTQVAMQPGKPQGFGHVGPDKTPIFTLPGNPVSAFVSFEVFVRPVLRRMLGHDPLHRPTVRAVLMDAVDSPDGKRQFLRGSLTVEDGRYVVRVVGGPGSHLLAGLSHADSLIVIPEEVTRVESGDAVTVMMLERRAG